MALTYPLRSVAEAGSTVMKAESCGPSAGQVKDEKVPATAACPQTSTTEKRRGAGGGGGGGGGGIGPLFRAREIHPSVELRHVWMSPT
mmetsp:Transcript_9180/g.27826  ORF Transcript_9180/g.27826 Transcript_9180/m.27826 type:complete len:88 (-) Transcript_9180:1691-1954(-)